MGRQFLRRYVVTEAMHPPALQFRYARKFWTGLQREDDRIDQNDARHANGFAGVRTVA